MSEVSPEDFRKAKMEQKEDKLVSRLLGDEALMLRIGGTAVGYVPTIFFPIIVGSLEQCHHVFIWLLLGWFFGWPAVLISLLYHARRIGAVTLTFAALAPLLTLFLQMIPAPFLLCFQEPVILSWICRTSPAALLLTGIEYSIKLSLKKRANMMKKDVKSSDAKQIHVIILVLTIVFTSLGLLISRNPYLLEPQRFFFIGDKEFAMPFDRQSDYGKEEWHKNEYSVWVIYEENDTLHLEYNSTDGYYGNSGIFAGYHADGRYADRLLVGVDKNSSTRQDFCAFYKLKPLIKGYFMRVRFRINSVSYTCEPFEEFGEWSQVKLGITLMCSYNGREFNSQSETVWFDLFFCNIRLDSTHVFSDDKRGQWYIARNVLTEPNVHDNDIHCGFWVGHVETSDFGEWVTIQFPLGYYIGSTIRTDS